MGDPINSTANAHHKDISNDVPNQVESSSPSSPAADSEAKNSQAQNRQTQDSHLQDTALVADYLLTQLAALKQTTTASKTPSSHKAATASEELQTLRNLILGASIEDVVQAHISPEILAPTLPGAFLEANQHQSGLPLAVMPTVEQAIQSSVQTDAATLADALFPIIGPATRKSITAAIGSLVESLNQTLEHSLSLESFKWRLEARRTGKTFAEVVLIRTLIYQVEQAFLIHKETGLVIQHAVADTVTAQDPDLVSAMLTAIQDFVADSFSVQTGQSLESLRVGNFTLFIESGPQAVLACVIRGTAPQELRATMRSQLEKIHYQFGPALRTYTGDATKLAGTESYLQECFQSEFKGAKKRQQRLGLSRKQKLVGGSLVGILAAGFCIWSLVNWQHNRQWQQLVRQLQQEPGLVVITQFKKGNRYYLQGLRDPLANNPQTLVAASPLKANSVNLTWKPYLSLEPEFLETRAQALLSPPATVSLKVDENGVLKVSGRASTAWIALAKQASQQLDSITRWDESALISIEQEELKNLRSRIESRRFAFAASQTVLQPERYTQTLYNQAQDINSLLKTAETIGQAASIHIYAHGDQPGSALQTLQLADRRAQYIKQYLSDQGVSVNVLQAEGQTIKRDRLIQSSDSPTQPELSEPAFTKHRDNDDSAAYLEVKFPP